MITRQSLIAEIVRQWNYYQESPHYLRFETAVIQVLDFAGVEVPDPGEHSTADGSTEGNTQARPARSAKRDLDELFPPDPLSSC